MDPASAYVATTAYAAAGGRVSSKLTIFAFATKLLAVANFRGSSKAEFEETRSTPLGE